MSVSVWITPAVIAGMGVFLWATTLLDRLVASAVVEPTPQPEAIQELSSR